MKRSLPTGAGSSGNNLSTSNTNNTSTNNQAYYQSHPPSSHLPNMPAAPSSSLSFGTSPQQGGNNSSADLLALLLASQQQNSGTSFSASSSSPSPFPQGVNSNHMTANPASFSSLQQLLQRQGNTASANVNPNPNPDYQQQIQQLMQMQQMLQMQNNSALIAQLTQQLAAGGTDPNADAAALLNNNPGGIDHSTGTNMAFQQQQQQQQRQPQGIPAMVQFPTSSNSGAATATAPPQDAQHQQQAQLQALAAAAASAQQQLQVQPQQAPQVQPRPTTPSTSIRQMHSQLLRNVTSGNNNPIAAQRSAPATSTDSHPTGSANNRHNPSSRMAPLANLNTDAPTTTAIERMNPKKLFVLVRILLAYLEKSDPELHAEAEKVGYITLSIVLSISYITMFVCLFYFTLTPNFTCS